MGLVKGQDSSVPKYEKVNLMQINKLMNLRWWGAGGGRQEGEGH